MDQPPQPEGFSPPPLRPEIVPEPIQAPPRRKSGFFVRLFWVVILLGLLGSAALNLLLFAVVGFTGLGSLQDGKQVREKTIP